MSENDNPPHHNCHQQPESPAIPVAYNGRTLEGIFDDERIPGSLIEARHLTFAAAPKSASDDYKRAHAFKERFEGWLEEIEACDPLTLDFVLMQLIYPLHQPPRRDFAVRRKLPEHVADDRRDPIALIVTAVQLLYDALPNLRRRQRCLDVGRLAYVHDKLREAELVQVKRRDVRFDALRALTAAVGAAIVKAEVDYWASLETLW